MRIVRISGRISPRKPYARCGAVHQSRPRRRSVSVSPAARRSSPLLNRMPHPGFLGFSSYGAGDHFIHSVFGAMMTPSRSPTTKSAGLIITSPMHTGTPTRPSSCLPVPMFDRPRQDTGNPSSTSVLPSRAYPPLSEQTQIIEQALKTKPFVRSLQGAATLEVLPPSLTACVMLSAADDLRPRDRWRRGAVCVAGRRRRSSVRSASGEPGQLDFHGDDGTRPGT